MGKMTRRLFVASGSLVGLSAVGFGASWLACKSVHRITPDFFALLEELPASAARYIGKASLRAGAAEPSLAEIEASLTSKPLLAEAMRDGCSGSRSALLQAQCGEDFAQDRTVLVDGWVLSETEAKLCAARFLMSA